MKATRISGHPEDLVALLSRFEQQGSDEFLGESRNIVGQRVFGGQVLGQALFAAALTVEKVPLCAIKGQFLSGGDTSFPITYSVTRGSDADRLISRRVIASQGASILLDFSAIFRFPDDDSPRHSLPQEIPAPEELETERESMRRFLEQERISENFKTALLRPNPLEVRPVDPLHPLRPGKSSPCTHAWLRIGCSLPDDPRLHQALLAYASDYSLLNVALRPHGLAHVDRTLQTASLDHAMWFHGSFRFDEWLLYAMDSPIASGGRAFTRGRIFSRDGRLIASVAQEGLIRRHLKTVSGLHP